MADATGAQILPFGPGDHAPPSGHDSELDRVEAWLAGQNRGRRRFGDVIRHSFDQVLDAERTGRYDLVELTETEQLYLAERFRILLRDEFDVPRGLGTSTLAFTVDGVGVEVSFEPAAGWILPIASCSAICILVKASDIDAKFSVGVLRCRPELVDADTVSGMALLTENALGSVRWFWLDEPMPSNILRSLPPKDVQAIFALPGKRNGQARINVLFERVLGTVIPRDLVVTVAHQRDSLKRVRDARPALQPQGIVILGHQDDHPRILNSLGLPALEKGQFIAARLVQATPQRQQGGRQVVNIGGKNWVMALPSEPNEPGPEWPY